jgi:hypothetical protein
LPLTVWGLGAVAASTNVPSGYKVSNLRYRFCGATAAITVSEQDMMPINLNNTAAVKSLVSIARYVNAAVERKQSLRK